MLIKVTDNNYVDDDAFENTFDTDNACGISRNICWARNGTTNNVDVFFWIGILLFFFAIRYFF